jgi:S-formylglutathione hydrolase FrmB
MKKLLLLLFILISFKIYSQSSIVNTTFFSISLNTDRNIQIILPPGYSPDDNIYYPVIYFLHGILSNHLSYSQLVTVLNNLYASSNFTKYIVVKPDASTGPYLGSFYTNSELYGNFEDYIINDVINFVEGTYKVKAGKENRFIAGHSMGGYGAMKMALKYPEKFSGVVSHSGPLDFNNFDAQLPYILQENGGVPPYNYAPEHGVFTIVFYTMAGAFSPDLSKPDSVELPLDVNGNFIQPILLKWMLHNPSGLVKAMDEFPGPPIYFDCGTLDELKLYEHNTGFRDTLDVLGLPYIFESFSGFHSNKISERLNISLLFIDSVYGSVITSVSDMISTPSEYRIYQNFPNPFNPSTEIRISLPEASHLTLKVYDALGSEVVTLAEESMSSGVYSFVFDGSRFSNGIYFCRMETGAYSSVIKMIMIK